MSRLTTLPPGWPVKTGHLAPFSFRDMGGWWLLANDWGHYLMLEAPDFRRFLAGEVKPEEPLWLELAQRGFVRESLDFPALARASARKNAFHRYPGPSLHMIVVTLRCNLACRYCHSSVVDPSRTDTDMDLATAKRVVDFIFDTPNPTICIEFQGGEPLLNWPVVKFVTRYAQRKAKGTGRRLIVSLVSNFNLMTQDKLDFLLEHHVSLCTSLDGPAELHDKNRPLLGGGASQEKVVKWLREISRRCKAEAAKNHYFPGALMTTTRHSLAYGREIVDLYVELGMDQVFLRPLSPIGYAKRVWKEIGYEPEAFVEFYDKTLDYILELNHRGVEFMERMAMVVLTKVLKGEDPGFMDMRSPAGAVLGCVAYNYNGDVFVSDEGRMVSHQGDDIFRVGSVFKSSWDDVMDHPTTAACASASVIDAQPMCSQCVYKAWCGVEPVFHYEMQHSIAGSMPGSNWCKGHMGIFDVIFRKLRDPKARAVFQRWMDRDQCRWQESDLHEPGTPHPGDDPDPEAAPQRRVEAALPPDNGRSPSNGAIKA